MRLRTVLPVAILALAACGGDDGGAATTGAQSTVTVTSAAIDTPTGIPDGVVSYAGLSQEHTSDDVTYDQTPPVGGRHDPEWATCQVYDAPIRTEQGVHSMEHGAVWITYEPGLAADQVAAIAALATGHDHVLVSPFEGLPSPVVASAWGQQLVLDSATDPRLAQFVAFFESGPQTPEPGAPC